MPIKVYSVFEITKLIKKILEGNFYSVWVEGEVSTLRRSSTGHLYFSLVDGNATLGCIIYKYKLGKIRFIPENGQKVIVYGHLSLYVKGGEYRLSVESIRDVGRGKQFYDLEILKRKFKEEGYFDRKRPIPDFPRKILVFTSETGAALRDIINIINRKVKGVEVFVYPITVQGDFAKNSILTALQLANTLRESVDVAIISRGGGSNEDLWVFNDPDVAKALFNLKFPTISAIGHEIDSTLCDFVSDRRVETPSAAAELITEKRVEMLDRLVSFEAYMSMLIKKILRFKKQELVKFSVKRNFLRIKGFIENKSMYVDRMADNINSSIYYFFSQKEKRLDQLRNKLDLRNPYKRIELAIDRAERLKERMNRLMIMRIKENKYKVEKLSDRIEKESRFIIGKKSHQLEVLSSKMKSLSPRAILEKGYSITYDNKGNVIKDASQIERSEYIKTLLHKGEIVSVVEKVERRKTSSS